MIESLDVEHQRRLRAERVLDVLRAIWGDELPPAPDSELRTLIDAIAADDAHAAAVRLVSQGDGVTYETLAALWRARGRTSEAVELATDLPAPVKERLRQLDLSLPQQATGTTQSPERTEQSPPAVAEGEPADAHHFGIWEYDPRTGLITFDAVTARLLGADPQAGSARIEEHLQDHVHPEDRERVAEALVTALAAGRTYELRFRIVSPIGVVTVLHSHARVLRDATSGSAHLTGLLTVACDREQARAPEVPAPAV